MDSNLVARVNVDAYCPKIRKKWQNVHSHVGCPKPSVWEMEITVYPLHGQSIGPISTALNRGRIDVTRPPLSPFRHGGRQTWAAKHIFFKLVRKSSVSPSISPFIHGGWQNKLDSAEIDVGKYFQ